jgi:hypothetical protein
MLSVVTWQWGTLFGVDYVNKLASMLRRHLHTPYLLHLITDVEYVDDDTLDYGVIQHPMFTDHAEMRAASRSCFRRLRMFDRDFGELLGPRILHLDLDCVIVDDITPLVDRPDPIVLVKQSEIAARQRVVHNPSMLLMDAGVLHEMWERFHADPTATWQAAKNQGWSCSDMSIINDYLYKNRATVKASTWDEVDGVQSYWRKDGKLLKKGARIVLFYGKDNPGDAAAQAQSPWIKEHWR